LGIQNDNLKKFHFDRGFFDAPKRYGQLMLFQAGDISCKGGYRIPTHMQLCYELSYIVSGEGIYRTDQKEENVSEGMLCLNLPGQLHDGEASREKPFRYLYLGFDFSMEPCNDNEYLEIKSFFDGIPYNTIRDNGGIQPLFTGLMNELVNPQKHSPLMVNLYLQQIVVSAFRAFQQAHNAVSTESIAVENSQQIVYQVVNYIETNLPSAIELSALAESLGYSISYLSHLFSKETGITIKRYYSQRRLEKAAEMLNSNECNVTQAAEKLNFSSVHSFSKAFKSYFGVAPSKYLTNLEANRQKPWFMAN